MKKLFFIFLSFLTGFSGLAQKQANVWHFGWEGGLDFNCSPPQPIKAAIDYYAMESSSAISDTIGNLLFYTNGDSVWNRNHETMPNGFGLGSQWCDGSSTQGSLIIPQPNSDSLYYIFATDCAENLLASGFTYSIVDMSIDGGLGDIVVKNELLIETVVEKVAAMHHANGNDIWVVTHEFQTDRFFTYQITSAGLNPTPVISSAGQVQYITPDPECAARGYMKFAPNGDQLIVLSVSDCHLYGLYPEVFNFDDLTGQITLAYTLTDTDSVNYYGASFSPNGDILYLSGGWSGLYSSYIHQYDLLAGSPAAILSSKVIIYEDSAWSDTPCALQLATDGKIYVADGNFVDWINIINNPNTLGLGCNYQTQAIMFTGCPWSGYVEYGLTNFIESYFRTPIIGSVCIDTLAADFAFQDICYGFPTYFYDSSIVYPEYVCDWKWNFDDPPSGGNNTSSLQNPTHTFTSSGTYDVQLIIKTHPDSICKLDTILQSITIEVCIGIEENAMGSNIVLHPNPTTGKFKVSGLEFGVEEIKIYDLFGRLILRTNKPEIDMSSYPAGLYIWSVGEARGKLVIE